MTETKTLKITNGIDHYSVDCDGSIRTRVSEECIKNFGEKTYQTPVYIVKKVLLYECGLDNENPNNWIIYE